MSRAPESRETEIFRRGRAFRIVAVLVCLGLFLPRPAAAQTEICRLPPEVDAISVTLQQMAGRDAIASGNLSYLRSLQRDISRSRVRSRVEASGMTRGLPMVMEMLDRAEQIAATGVIADTEGLQRLIRNIDQMVRLNCVPLGGNGTEATQPQGTVTYAETRDLPKNFVTRVIEPILGIGAALLMVTGIAAAVVAGGRVFRWFMAYLYNTKACRIPAILMSRDGSFPVEGLVTTMGRGGLRFQPDDVSLMYARLEAMPGGKVTLTIGDEAIPATVSESYSGYAHFRFAERLSVQRQQEILQRSIITPFYIERSRRRGLNLRRAGF